MENKDRFRELLRPEPRPASREEVYICLGLLESVRSRANQSKDSESLKEWDDTISDGKELLRTVGDVPSEFARVLATHEVELVEFRTQLAARARRCRLCGVEVGIPLETIHLRAQIDVVPAPENLLLLCPNCHQKVDQGARRTTLEDLARALEAGRGRQLVISEELEDLEVA